MKLFALLILLSITSCSSLRVSSISELKEISKYEEKKCEYIKHLEFETDKVDEREVLNNFKTQVMKANGDAYLIDELIKNGAQIKVSGAAFNCNKK